VGFAITKKEQSAFSSKLFLSLTRNCPFGANGNARLAWEELKPALEPSPENLRVEIDFSL